MSMPGASRTAATNVGEIDLRAAGVQSLDTAVCTGIADSSDRCLVFAINTWRPGPTRPRTSSTCSSTSTRTATEDYVLVRRRRRAGVHGRRQRHARRLRHRPQRRHARRRLRCRRSRPTARPCCCPRWPATSASTRTDRRRSTTGSRATRYESASRSADVMHTGDTARTQRQRPLQRLPAVAQHGLLQVAGGGQGDQDPARRCDTATYRPGRGQKGWLVVTMDDSDGARPGGHGAGRRATVAPRALPTQGGDRRPSATCRGSLRRGVRPQSKSVACSGSARSALGRARRRRRTSAEARQASIHQVRAVVAHVVDARRDGVDVQDAVGGGREHRAQQVLVPLVGIEPGRPRVARQQHRHPVVERAARRRWHRW